MADKPRILINGKDMFWTMVPLLALVALVAIASGNCSVGVDQEPSADKVAEFNVKAALEADAREMPFPVRMPPTPEGWKANSGSSPAIEGHRVSTVGWLSASGAYVQLSQTDAPEDVLVTYLAGDDTTLNDLTATGTRDLAGHKWVTYETAGDKRFWITDLGDVRIGVLTRGPVSDIETIGASVVEQRPLPKPSATPGSPSGTR
ncbi:DUF4245 domain-containing protein [Gordonia aurantiaca]|uniref:DUF4245 domain-containing protein n=1 Tax=Gordonia sp. B21 TaxID=3151852 RepID=UPI0032678F12